MGAVAPSIVPPRDMPDTILFAARLARGLTLLTQGTAHDIITNQYVNPSDWQDRPLTHFIAADHIPIMQATMSRAIESDATPSASASSEWMNSKCFSPLVSLTSLCAISSEKRQTN